MGYYYEFLRFGANKERGTSLFCYAARDIGVVSKSMRDASRVIHASLRRYTAQRHLLRKLQKQASVQLQSSAGSYHCQAFVAGLWSQEEARATKNSTIFGAIL